MARCHTIDLNGQKTKQFQFFKTSDFNEYWNQNDGTSSWQKMKFKRPTKTRIQYFPVYVRLTRSKVHVRHFINIIVTFVSYYEHATITVTRTPYRLCQYRSKKYFQYKYKNYRVEIWKKIKHKKSEITHMYLVRLNRNKKRQKQPSSPRPLYFRMRELEKINKLCRIKLRRTSRFSRTLILIQNTK